MENKLKPGHSIVFSFFIMFFEIFLFVISIVTTVLVGAGKLSDEMLGTWVIIDILTFILSIGLIFSSSISLIIYKEIKGYGKEMLALNLIALIVSILIFLSELLILGFILFIMIGYRHGL